MCREVCLQLFSAPGYGERFWLLVPIHDSLFLEVLDEHVDETVTIVKALMEQPWQELNGLSVEVDTKIGMDWASMRPYLPGRV